MYICICTSTIYTYIHTSEQRVNPPSTQNTNSQLYKADARSHISLSAFKGKEKQNVDSGRNLEREREREGRLSSLHTHMHTHTHTQAQYTCIRTPLMLHRKKSEEEKGGGGGEGEERELARRILGKICGEECRGKNWAAHGERQRS